MFSIFGNPQMEQDPYAYDDQFIEATQQATQSQSQEEKDTWDDSIWGFLKPASPGLSRLDFAKRSACISIGRSSENLIIFSNMKISNKHCTIQWDGISSKQSVVTVQDYSTNGTFINGRRVGKGQTNILCDGSEIVFGPFANIPCPEDFRYIFRFTAGGATPNRPLTGLLASYDVGRELGRGSFATVYYAVHRETGYPYAVKRIHKNNLRADRNAAKSFMREIEILRKIQHPNVCTLKQSFEEGGTIDLVLEYVDGGDLLDYIINLDGVSENDARELTYQLCDAINYIHRAGVGHRDLKPENILLKKGSPPTIKVADFGLAKAVDSVTQFKTTCGTPCYLAPEVILRDGKDAYDYTVDNWSIGVIVFSMITSANPFIEETQLPNIAQRFARRYIDWTPLGDRNVTPECKDFIRRFLKEDPRIRMTCEQALKHPWLAPAAARRHHTPAETTTTTKTTSITPAAAAPIAALQIRPEVDNESFMSSRAIAGSFYESFGNSAGAELEDGDGDGNGDVRVGPPGSTPAALPLSPPAQAQTSRMAIANAEAGANESDAIMASIPGAFPPTQELQERQERNRDSQGIRERRISRQPMEIAQRDESGELLDFRAFPMPPSDDRAARVYAETAKGKDAKTNRERGDSAAAAATSDDEDDSTSNVEMNIDEALMVHAASESTDSMRDNDNIESDDSVGRGTAQHPPMHMVMQRTGTKRKERSPSMSISCSPSPSPAGSGSGSGSKAGSQRLQSLLPNREARGSGPSDSSLTAVSESNAGEEFGVLPTHAQGRNLRSVSGRGKANADGADVNAGPGAGAGRSIGPMTRSSARGHRNGTSKRSRR